MAYPSTLTSGAVATLICFVLGGCTPAVRNVNDSVGCMAATRSIQRDGSTGVVQPNYQKWQLITVGMDEAEVNRLVGPPLERGSEDPKLGDVYVCVYGRLGFDRRLFPEPYTFYVIFQNGTHRVFQVVDPFEGDFAGPDGWPTIPKLIYPADRAEFDHYPRYLDLRWKPSSGIYPMEYEVQTNAHPDQGWSSRNVRTYGTDVPYLAITWVGRNAGTWRVRAINGVGASQWSEERTLRFDR